MKFLPIVLFSFIASAQTQTDYVLNLAAKRCEVNGEWKNGQLDRIDPSTISDESVVCMDEEMDKICGQYKLEIDICPENGG